MTPTRRLCQQCSNPMPVGMRADAQFCGAACRMRHHRDAKRKAPRELEVQARWVRRNAKKVPLTTAGQPASVTDSSTWATAQACSYSKAGVGSGIVLTGDGVICIDLDHCLVNGQPTDAAKALLAKLPEGWVEVSPSGDGLHVWGRSDAFRYTGRKLVRDGLSVEVYGTGRYVTTTGVKFGGNSVALPDLTSVVADLIGE